MGLRQEPGATGVLASALGTEGGWSPDDPEGVLLSVASAWRPGHIAMSAETEEPGSGRPGGGQCPSQARLTGRAHPWGMGVVI